MNCYNLQYVPNLTLTAVDASYYGLFFNCWKLRRVGSVSRTTEATNTYANSMFTGCSGLVDAGTIDMHNITSAYQMFSGCTDLTSVTLTNVDSLTNSG